MRIAWLKCSPPPGLTAAAAAAMPGSIFSISSGTPITPVEATATSSTGSRRCCAVRRRMRAASPRPSLPVQALALPAFTTTACRRSQAEVSRVRRTGAAAAALPVNVAADTLGRSDRKHAEVELAPLLHAGGDAGGDEPLGERDAALGLGGERGELDEARRGEHQGASPSASRGAETPRSQEPLGLGQAQHQVHVLDRLSRGALHEVVDDADDDDPGRRARRRATKRRQQLVPVTSLRRGGASQTATKGSPAYGLLVERRARAPRSAAGRSRGARRWSRRCRAAAARGAGRR